MIHTVLKETYSAPTAKHPDAAAARAACHARAKELRKAGYSVKTQRVSFSDLARAESYILVATKGEA